jgi:protein TonB
MRKVYHNEKKTGGLAVALLAGVGVTGVLFGILPFSHIIATPKAAVELRTAAVAELPPPVEPDQPPEAPEEEKAKETEPEPQLAAETPQAIPLTASLETVGGSGGGLAGFGDFKEMTRPEAIKDDVVDAGDLEKRPEPMSQVAPAYPAELRKAKTEGVVTLLFLLSEEGRVEDARVENSSRPEFEKPALDAIRKWRFRPGMKDGQPVRTYLRMPMRFRVSTG